MKTLLSYNREKATIEINKLEAETLLAALIIRCKTFEKEYEFSAPMAEKLKEEMLDIYNTLNESE